ncbi:MAG: hypothetical protein ACEPOZ_19835 [Marinifilaceae bacterium]
MKGSTQLEKNEGTFSIRLPEPVMGKYPSAKDAKKPEKAFLHRSKGRKESGNCLVQKGNGCSQLVILPNNTEKLSSAWDDAFRAKPHISDPYLVFRFQPQRLSRRTERLSRKTESNSFQPDEINFRPQRTSRRTERIARRTESNPFRPQGTSRRTESNPFRPQGTSRRTESNPFRPENFDLQASSLSIGIRKLLWVYLSRITKTENILFPFFLNKKVQGLPCI